jgi:hypothetical protein
VTRQWIGTSTASSPDTYTDIMYAINHSISNERLKCDLMKRTVYASVKDLA